MKNFNLVYKINATNTTNHIVCAKLFIFDMTDFTQVISCSKTTHVSTKQKLAVIFGSF